MWRGSFVPRGLLRVSGMDSLVFDVTTGFLDFTKSITMFALVSTIRARHPLAFKTASTFHEMVSILALISCVLFIAKVIYFALTMLDRT